MEEKNLDIYGNGPLHWPRALERLEAAAMPPDGETHRTWWLATVHPDGRPHIAGVGALWFEGKLYFTSGDATRKGRNLAENPSCAISVALPGIDLVVEGTASKVTDETTLQRLAELYAALGWPARAQDGALTAEFSAPSAGPPPWFLYAMTAKVAFGLATVEPYGASRWTFD
jgi:pyridoxine/pyridoxamine 5'-phosphate oxidase